LPGSLSPGTNEEAAGDFNSALRKIEDYDYDCILLDIMLPDGSGLSLKEGSSSTINIFIKSSPFFLT